MIHCSKCGKDVSKNAKFCPYCRNPIKKEIYKQWWFWLIIIFWFFVIVGALGEDTETNSNTSNNSGSQNSTPTIEYTKVDIDDMENELENNAAAASEKYKGKYLEVTGRLGTIDSSLKYFSLESPTDKWDLTGIYCRLKDSKTREFVKTLSRNQIISVKGQITDVGEVLGYYMNVDEIVPQ